MSQKQSKRARKQADKYIKENVDNLMKETLEQFFEYSRNEPFIKRLNIALKILLKVV